MYCLCVCFLEAYLSTTDIANANRLLVHFFFYTWKLYVYKIITAKCLIRSEC